MNDIPNICRLYNDFFVYNASQQPQYYQQAIEKGKYPQSVIGNAGENGIQFYHHEKFKAVSQMMCLELRASQGMFTLIAISSNYADWKTGAPYINRRADKARLFIYGAESFNG